MINMSITSNKNLLWAAPTGEFKRQVSSFRDTISSEPGSRFTPEAGRYHLYASIGCPWVHRVLITRALKGLNEIVSVSSHHLHADTRDPKFLTDELLETSEEFGPLDRDNEFKNVKDAYLTADPEYNARFTVPALWDKKHRTIVNNESSEIIRIFNLSFNLILPEKYLKIDVYPENLRAEIDEVNSWVYENINNGVYKAGFATQQSVYDKEVVNLFKNLDKLELQLKEKVARNNIKNLITYLVGDQLTEADIRLFVTIIRFDIVYFDHFKCNLKLIRLDYPNIHKWLRLLYWTIPAFKNTSHLEKIKYHYNTSHIQINPLGIVPVGPLPYILPL